MRLHVLRVAFAVHDGDFIIGDDLLQPHRTTVGQPPHLRVVLTASVIVSDARANQVARLLVKSAGDVGLLFPLATVLARLGTRRVSLHKHLYAPA